MVCVVTMEEAVAKTLSALLLLVSSLSFGLLIPYLVWKSRVKNRESSSCPNQQEEETQGLLSGQQNSSNFDCISNQETCGRRLTSIKVTTANFESKTHF